VSLVSYGLPPGALGDYEGTSVHNHGEMLGAMLDLIVRDHSGDTRSIDDVMRAMMERYSGRIGFTGRDIERTVADICRCTVQDFFAAHVRGTRPIDFDRYLKLVGLRARITREPARNDSGRAIADLRIRAWQPPGETTLRLILLGPESVWGRAGLHTGDRLTSLNGRPIASYAEFRAIVFVLRIGDTLRLDVARPSGPMHTTVVVPGYERPVVHIEERPDATTRQRAMRARWLRGTP
jgi:predicted metalloprotease with PDZ domain